MLTASRRLPLLLLLAPVACRSVGDPGRAPDDVRPTMEEIFLIPGIHGRPPRAQSLSADGEWLLLRWNPMTLDEDGEREISGANSLRLLSVSDPATGNHRGHPLSDVLPLPEPQEGEESERSARTPTTAWSRSGSTLAVSSEGSIWLMHAPADGIEWTAELLFANPEEPEETEETEEGEATEEAEPPRRLKRVRSLSFTEGDRALRVSGGGELLELPLDAPRPLTLDDARWISDVLERSATGVQWSDDETVAFSTSHVGEIVTGTGGDEAKTKAQVWRAGGGLVVLEGFEELEDLRSERLSPDGRWVMGMTTDDSGQPDPTLVPDYLTTRVSTRKARAQWADDTASPRTYAVWDATSGARTTVELPHDEGTWLSPLGWAPMDHGGERAGPARYAWRRVSADWRTMELWVWSAGELRRAYTEHDERWVGGPAAWPQWSEDGSCFLYGSEIAPSSLTPGRSQVFAIDPDTGAMRQLTEAEGEVSRFSSTTDGGLVYAASGANPAQTHIGLVPAEAVAGSATATRDWSRRLPVPPGVNESPLVSRDGSRVVFTHHELGLPAELWCVETDGRSEPWRLTRTIPAEYEAVDWIRPVKFEAAHADGTLVRSHVYLPEGMTLAQPQRPRACIVFIHGAGYLQNVTDSMTEYEVNLMFHSRLARMGYVVLDVDYRGSKGYGNDFRTRLQYHLGGLDLDDIHRVVDALAERGVIDGERVACYGGSYGGFLTLMALFTAPERWVAGAALRSVTDWRTYHPRYTQPRLGRPSTHPEAFERSSPIDHAEKLEDPLLILHGMVDSNVFAQDSIRLIEKLIDAGKGFDAMLYPSQGHTFSDGMHWLDEYGRIERFLTGHLGPP
jgi:dipeptidyl aminopeptidase/acylaminoacyl peptidase